ncbi:P-loop NTPase fold protein [Actinoplanes sp. NBRC 103695]|uniref:P-loop NTPase fold protein n=1 Tax=Actinoplanes sp. NBRC 103695 TaxID=3032202 RepID=UPI0024A09925|nr:P-loop NTPase fold protein [Actinoplanes sp. NBRC 103695]GLZ01838.1 hypothetical protein Acsp02_90890 [Actinoplanes sp. NBRC 103695]
MIDGADFINVVQALGGPAAEALATWAEERGLTVRWPSSPPLTTGRTGARLAMVIVSAPREAGRRVLVRALSRGTETDEPALLHRARSLGPTGFVDEHLPKHAYEPFPIADGGLLWFLEPPAGPEGSRALADLPEADLAECFEAVVRSVVLRWRTARGATVPKGAGEFLRAEMRLVGNSRAVADHLGLLRPDLLYLRFLDGGTKSAAVPNPALMPDLPELGASVWIETAVGPSHGDLHAGNVLIPIADGRSRPRSFQMIDLARFEPEGPVTRDPATLLLSLLAPRLSALPIDERAALLDHLVAPRRESASRLRPALRQVADSVDEALDELGFDDWRSQYLLSLTATAMRYLGSPAVDDDARWWFLRLAGQAGAEFLRRRDRYSPVTPVDFPRPARWTAATETPVPDREWRVGTRGFGDRPATVDVLRREAMVAALSDLIDPGTEPGQNPDDSGPTVVALDGAWGTGKSTLVELIQARLPRTVKPDADPPAEMTVRDADRALSGRGLPLWSPPAVGRTGLITVQFEPWAHENAGQVWAGITKALVKATCEVITPTEESARRFWFERNIKRLDRMRLRRSLRRSVLSPWLATAALALIAPLVAQLARSTDTYNLAGVIIAGSNIAILVAVAGLLAGLLHTAVRYLRRPAADFLPADLFVGPVQSGTFGGTSATGDESLRDPYHHARSGYLYLAQHDVFDLLGEVKACGHQVIVFIDDIDRCTPRTTAEVFEAINLFVTRTFPVTRFVLCLDSTAVAAHLDEAYSALRELTVSGDDPSGGWSFLRKLVQLHVPVPAMSPAVLEKLLDSLLARTETPVAAPSPTPPADSVDGTPAAGPEPAPSRPEPAYPDGLTQSTVDRVVAVVEDDDEIRKRILERWNDQPNLSVRESKRMLTIWQYYVRVLIHLGEPGLVRQAMHLVILAEIVARWPASQRALFRRTGDGPVLVLLARAASEHEEWTATIRSLKVHGDAHRSCTKALRDLLTRYDGHAVADLAARLT